MLEYILIFILAVIAFLSENKFFNTLLILFMILMSGFRDMIGGFDVYIYSEVYEVLKGEQLYLYHSFEKGFLSFYWILQKISYSREFMLFSIATIYTSGMCFLLKKLSPIFTISLFIFFGKFFLFSFTYLRQELAVLIACSSLFFLLSNSKSKIILTFLTILLASTFHKSALIFLLIPIISNRNFSELQYLLFALLVLTISISPIGNLTISSLAEQSGDEKLLNYAKEEQNVNFLYLIEGSIISFLIIKYKKLFVTEYEKLIINGVFLYIIVTFISIINASFLRLTWFFYIFIMIFIPTICIKTNLSKTIKPALIIYFGFLYFRLLLIYGPGEYYPYKSIFQDFDRHGHWEFMEYRRNN